MKYIYKVKQTDGSYYLGTHRDCLAFQHIAKFERQKLFQEAVLIKRFVRKKYGKKFRSSTLAFNYARRINPNECFIYNEVL